MTVETAVLSILGVAVTIYYGRKAVGLHQRRPEHVADIRRWRRQRFDQAMDYLSDYVDANERLPEFTPDANSVDRRVLRSWSAHLLLTAASMISPASQGKANLFVVHARDEAEGVIRLRSKYFAGPFPLWQLIKDDDDTYRDFSVPLKIGASRHHVAVAGKAILANAIQFEAISDQRYRSDPEKKLRATHILGIPICQSVELLKPGNPAAITVDLRLTAAAAFACRHGLIRIDKRISGRAEEIQKAARNILKGADLLENDT